MRITFACTVAGMALAMFACHAPPPAVAEQAEHEAEHEPEHEAPAAAHDSDAGEKPHAHLAHRFAVPFAAELDRDDPLAQTRGYFQQVFADNASYMRTHDPPFFRAFAGAQKPRATVVTCSDSRVQTPAFDATPENDDFFVRNVGNQIANAAGSVDYGVHHLKTPVLLVLGHTGCGAIKAAMGDASKESDALKKELAPLAVPKSTKADDPSAWADAVVANVNDQVTAALAAYGDDVASGQLTIVGAVYDFRNDLRQGLGKVVLVNVNGNREPGKLQAFERGVLGIVAPEKEAKADAGAPRREGKDREARR